MDSTENDQLKQENSVLYAKVFPAHWQVILTVCLS